MFTFLESEGAEAPCCRARMFNRWNKLHHNDFLRNAVNEDMCINLPFIKLISLRRSHELWVRSEGPILIKLWSSYFMARTAKLRSWGLRAAAPLRQEFISPFGTVLMRASTESSCPCIQTALLRRSVCTPTGDAANSMTSSSEVMCLKQKPQRTLIPNYQWTRCHVCRPWISKLPLVGRHEHACGTRARVLFPMTGFILFFFLYFFSLHQSVFGTEMSNHAFFHLGQLVPPPSFRSTGRQRGTALCVLVPILSDILQLFLWGYTASCLPIVHSVVGWLHMYSACLYVNERRIYWLSFCSTVSEFISISNLFSHIRCGFTVV